MIGGRIAIKFHIVRSYCINYSNKSQDDNLEL